MSEEFIVRPEDDDNEQSSKVGKKGIKKSAVFLQDMPLPKIASEFSNLRINKEDVTMVIPIGFPQAGKSLFLSSMIYHASKNSNTLFELNRISQRPFDKGHKAADEMIDYFSNRKIYSLTQTGTLDLIGIKIRPIINGRPELNLAFLDLAGEDIKNIKTSIKGDFTEKINAVFNGLRANQNPIIFFLITPFSPPKMNEDETDREAHAREDSLHADFLDYLEQYQPEILNTCQLFVIVSQWDRNLDPKLKIEDYMSQHRKSLFNKVKSKNIVWGSYSVGRLLKQVDDNGMSYVQELVQINDDYPNRLWKKLYYVCTRKHLDTWWSRLFS
jgi:hypothetical protein